MQWKTPFHLKRAGGKYSLCILGKCLHTEQQISLGHGEQCLVPQRQWKEWKEGGSRSRDFRARGAWLRQGIQPVRPGEQLSPPGQGRALLKVCENTPSVELNPPEERGFPTCSPVILTQCRHSLI